MRGLGRVRSKETAGVGEEEKVGLRRGGCRFNGRRGYGIKGVDRPQGGGASKVFVEVRLGL